MSAMEDIIKGKILAVDDGQINLKMLEELLRSSGYDVTCLTSAKEAFTELTVNQYDLILLDILMPQIDGYEACRQIKKMHLAKETPIIFITALTEVHNLVEGFDAGGVDYITKPFNSAELRARIRTHIELKRAKDEIKTLQGLIPICSQCKSIRTEEGAWTSLEKYIRDHTDACFTHGLCDDCAKERYGEEEWYKKKHQSETE